MRAMRLEVEGFTAFRGRTVVDFTGAELFALCGPTGAGKTSVIDAVTFALYGSIPRLADQRAVAPVISQGLVEAKVRLDFTVGDGAFTAVRVVRATKAGASTKEARLERAGGEVLAADADGMTAAVTDLLGLDFRQFTTCVSLPQGDFARFLHDKPRDRQDLLVRLLDLGLYEAVRAAAAQRAALAGERARIAEARLDDLAWAGAEAKAEAAARVDALTSLRDRIRAAEPAVDDARRQATEAGRAAEAAAAAVVLLDAVRVPDGVDALAADVAAASMALAGARGREEAAAAAFEQAVAALTALPPRASLEALVADRSARTDVVALVAKGEVTLDDARRHDEEAQTALAVAEAAASEAAAALEATRAAHLAHALAADLVVGEACPVCRQLVGELPDAKVADLKAAETTRSTVDRRLQAARTASVGAGKERARVEEKLAAVVERLAELDERLAAAPSEDELAAVLGAVAAAEAAAVSARAEAEAARRSRVAAEEQAATAGAAEQAARKRFDELRDPLVALGAPAAARDDLATDWGTLAAWVAGRRPEVAAEEAESRRRAAAAGDELVARLAEVREACVAAGVEPGDSPRDAAVDALARAERDVQRVEEALGEAARVREAAAAGVEARDVARALADHLAANRFEQWLLDEVVHHLVAAATVRLQELSGGAYSLQLDAKSRSFAVVDHVNADTVRTARTLSGGETFLASLALALALADQVAAYATGGAARLETILLDEGFGTLDPDTLEVVAGALEELGASGRTVGVVTHVRELAERLPVRFEVRKVAGAATIERVDQ